MASKCVKCIKRRQKVVDICTCIVLYSHVVRWCQMTVFSSRAIEFAFDWQDSTLLGIKIGHVWGPIRSRITNNVRKSICRIACGRSNKSYTWTMRTTICGTPQSTWVELMGWGWVVWSCGECAVFMLSTRCEEKGHQFDAIFLQRRL